MLTAPSSVRVFVATASVDMRRGIDGLVDEVSGCLGLDPLSGAIFVFFGRTRRDRIKVLVWDGTGFWLHYKRLETGRFHFPAGPGRSVEIDTGALAALVRGYDLSQARHPLRWSPRRSSPSAS